jgi:hypothetical protein
MAAPLASALLDTLVPRRREEGAASGIDQSIGGGAASSRSLGRARCAVAVAIGAAAPAAIAIKNSAILACLASSVASVGYWQPKGELKGEG